MTPVEAAEILRQMNELAHSQTLLQQRLAGDMLVMRWLVAFVAIMALLVVLELAK